MGIVDGPRFGGGERAVVWGAVAVAVVANVLGYVLNLYDRWRPFDEVLHGYTLFATTMLLGMWAYRGVLTGFRQHGVLVVLAIASFGVAIGALWEVAEWAYDRTVAADAIKGKDDTIIDLIADAAGALMAGVVVLVMVRRR